MANPPNVPDEEPVRSRVLTPSLEQPLIPALLASSLVHIALLLILSLVVFSGTSFEQTSELVFAQTEELSISQLAEFEIKPANDQQPPDSLSATTEPDLRDLQNLDFSLPLKIESASAPAFEPTNAADQVQSETSVPISQVALSIQQRVAEAGGKQGEVQFALAWKNTNDIDLHVIPPSGERISHLHKHSACRGMLDVDMNVRGESMTPVENVRWISQAPWGRYSVLVNLFRIHRARDAKSRVYRGSEFQLLAQLGIDSTLERGIVNGNNQVMVFRYRYVSDQVSPSERERLLNEIDYLQAQEEASAQPLLTRATETRTPQLRDRLLNNLIMQYPHTDAAVEAMQRLGGSMTKD